MSDIAIRVENLSKLYHIGAHQERSDTMRDALSNLFRRKAIPEKQVDETKLWALKDVSFDVKKGEVIGIIGRNGAGKSTLLKILSRITEPTSGYAKINGRVGSLLEVGTGFHPELTGRENIYLNGAILGMRRHEIERKFDEIVAFAETEKFLDTPVKRYSSGMYVRLAFAVAAHLEIEILLVDEVLAVGDIQFQKKCLGKMGNVAKEGRTVLFVSHNMATVLSLCNRVLVMQNGSKQFDGLSKQGVPEYLKSDQSGQGGAVVDLDHLQRLPHQQSLITKLRILNNEMPTSQLDINEPIKLEISLFLPERIDSPTLGVGINNYLGIRVSTITTFLQSIQLPPLKGQQTIVCCIEGLKLVPGTYGLKLALGNGIEDLDSVEINSAFTILESDFWGSGKLPGYTQGSVLANASWKLIT